MNMFVHLKLGHFLMDENDGEGNDLGGEGEQQEEEEQEEEEPGEEEEPTEEEEDEVVVTLGGKALESEEDSKTTPDWVKKVRQENRDKAKRIKELEAQIEKDKAPAAIPQLGRKPTMDDADIDYDADKFEAKLTAWHDQKRAIEAQQHAVEQEKRKAEDDWKQRLAGYETAKSALKVKDFDDAEDNVRNAFSVMQQGILVQGAENSPLVVYALGKNPKEAARLAGITDPIKFATAIGRLEAQLKVTNKKSAPAPERTISGGRSVAGSSDATLERLRAEAERTGDSSKVIAYKRNKKAQARG